jgi:N-acetylneuraminic acid mutarotase
MNFNLPEGTKWSRTWRTMPSEIYGSQLAVIDGYIYMFGGEGSNVIWQAPTNNPANWSDTGGRLPNNLSNAQYFDVNDGYIYLVGGKVLEVVDTIYRASKTNPLVWTNMGSVLPRPLHKSQLAVINGFIYLFGGEDLTHSANVIFRAPISNPLSWTDTGATLPDKLYASTLAIIAGQIYLLGGLFKEDTSTNRIYSASVSTPTNWQQDGYLPFAAAYGQYVTDGYYGYLFTPGSITDTNYNTRILRVNISTPTSWIDTQHVLPEQISNSQLAVIYDRFFLFGGNGTTVILACDQNLKYKPSHPVVEGYGTLTRVTYLSSNNPNNGFVLLGYPPWKTDYSFNL